MPALHRLALPSPSLAFALGILRNPPALNLTPPSNPTPAPTINHILTMQTSGGRGAVHRDPEPHPGRPRPGAGLQNQRVSRTTGQLGCAGAAGAGSRGALRPAAGPCGCGLGGQQECVDALPCASVYKNKCSHTQKSVLHLISPREVQSLLPCRAALAWPKRICAACSCCACCAHFVQLTQFLDPSQMLDAILPGEDEIVLPKTSSSGERVSGQQNSVLLSSGSGLGFRTYRTTLNPGPY